MTALAQFCMLSHGWRRMAVLLVAGALAALSAPPWFLLPLLFVALPVLVWTLDGAERLPGWRGRAFGPAFRIGFWFGVGYFLVALHWIGAAFLVDGGWQIAAMPVALLVLAGGLAVFWGLGTALAHTLWSGSGMRLVALAFGLSLAEWARGTLLTGFPFDLLGYALTANLEMMQAASLVGVYGLTVVVILLASTPALIWPALDRPLASRLWPFFAALGIIALQLGYGHWRLETTAIESTGTQVRLVQPAIPQDRKWQVYARADIVSRLIDLSTAQSGPEDAGLLDTDLLIWPEAAIPFYFSDEPELFAQIARILPPDTTLVTGAPRLPYGPQGEVDRAATPYNSVLAINASGEVVSSYDKTHLVPIGEYLPFQEIFARFGLQQFVTGSSGWARGEERRLIDLPAAAPFLPLICYEAVYPVGLGDPVADAAFLMVLTNDAWFDGTVGPAQHFHHARLRSVEQGLAMIRSANSGVSGIVDPLGRVTGRLAAGAVATLDGAPARPIAPPLFARLGNLPFVLMLAAALVLTLLERRRARRGGVFA